MPETPSVGDKFAVGEHVWAKVKGFPFWPGKIVEGDTIKGKKKNCHCVYFFGSKNYAWVQQDSIKNYEESREAMLKNSKNQTFKNAVKECEQSIEETSGKKLPTPTFLNTSTISTKSAGNTSTASLPSTPAPVASTPKPDLFKKKTPATQNTPIQKDYSRTPFKKDKRSFDAAFDAIMAEPLPAKKLDAKEPSVGGDKGKRSVKLASATTTLPSFSSSSTPTTNKRGSMTTAAATPTSTVKATPATVSSSKGLDYDATEFDVSSSNLSKMEQISISKKRGQAQRSNLRYGFIGLGKMGSNLLRHMIEYDHKNITIWNRTSSKCKEFEKLGCTVAKTPGDVIRESDITFSCLSDAQASAKIFFGNCGVSTEINASKGYVELTPLDPTTSANIESHIKTRRGRYLEAPLISGLWRQVEEGTLTALISGNRSLFDDCGSFFEAICSHVYFLSENAGNASKMNIVISALYGNTVGALVEALTLVDRLGLIQKDFVEIMKSSPFCSPLIMDKAESMLHSTFIREVPIDNVRRDMHYALELSDQINCSTPIMATTNEMLKQKKQHYF